MKTAIEMLKEDHVRIKGLLQKLVDTTNRAEKGRTQLLVQIADELEAHTIIEEEILYPAFYANAEDSDDKEMFHEAMEEHRAVEKLVLPDLRNTDVTSHQFGGRAKVLKEMIEHHIEEEEEDLFKRIHKVIDADRLEDLARAIHERKTFMLKAS